MANPDHYRELADGLEAAAKAARACAQEEAGEEPEPKNLKEAEGKARRVMRSARQADENTSEK